MRNLENRKVSSLPRASTAVFATFLAIALLNLSQTSVTQWAPRPDIACDNGEAVHRYAEVNATRVNIRDLPTVFSNVLTQKSAPDRITVICEFGVWSRIELLDVGTETWISMGLITLVAKQPLTSRTKLVYLSLLIIGALGLLIALYRPNWVTRAIDLLLQTQDLPAHARPLISVVPQYHPVRDGKR
ncbi:MAG: hypothetical protein CMD54_01310 [Gammaproteobacteria bacterium]|mgnify:FL=1|nr:hypothetical protein [Gammaproteobacteria bacterium]HAN81406.1 hypothetical protein [Gammaproteobacteria bacterium]